MFKVLLVDDEMPALGYLEAIINKHLFEFYIAAKFFNGEGALGYLKEHTIDLLITDINMPGMDGITLANRARNLYPEIHIVIISGYAEFDYAMGAIKASVDGYILKPICAESVVEALQSVKDKLSDKVNTRRVTLLPFLACRHTYDTALATHMFGESRFLYALVRWGNLPNPLPSKKLHATSVIKSCDSWYAILKGRDENERVIIARCDSESLLNSFHENLHSYMESCFVTATWTAVYSNSASAIENLNKFIIDAMTKLDRAIVIGVKKLMRLDESPTFDVMFTHIDATTLRNLDFNINNLNKKNIQDILYSLSLVWEKQKIPQFYVTRMIRIIVDRAIIANPVLYNNQESILHEISELYLYSTSYSELTTSIYSVLFDDNLSQNKQLSARDLYECAMTYTRDNLGKPISIQSVCAGIGISQTYLSRLFRKYGDTTFNTFLTKCRIESAMSLIRQNPNTILRQVAACVGYDDPLYFSKVFNRVVGLTPTQYATLVAETDTKRGFS